MIIYETANGNLYTRVALLSKTGREAAEGWDEATQGSFRRNYNVNDWLIEAVQAGVVKERVVIE
jgi:hypothetical protein